MVNIYVPRLIWGKDGPPSELDFGDWIFFDGVDDKWRFSISGSTFINASIEAVRNYKKVMDTSFGEIHLYSYELKRVH